MSVARPRSEDKRMAILEAATEAIAEAGLGASTALIARKAGVAEGTIFRYFASKDDLYNALYVHLKQDFCRSMIGKLDSKNDHKENIRYVWNSFIDWGLTKPEANLAARKLEVSSRITDESKKLVTISTRSSMSFARNAFCRCSAPVNFARLAMKFSLRWRRRPWISRRANRHALTSLKRWDLIRCGARCATTSRRKLTPKKPPRASLTMAGPRRLAERRVFLFLLFFFTVFTVTATLLTRVTAQPERKRF